MGRPAKDVTERFTGQFIELTVDEQRDVLLVLTALHKQAKKTATSEPAENQPESEESSAQ